MAILAGMHASTTGCYTNEVFHYDHPALVGVGYATPAVAKGKLFATGDFGLTREGERL